LTDGHGRPIAFGVTAGNTHDLVDVEQILRSIPTPLKLIADHAYDAKRLCDWLNERSSQAAIPPNPTRQHPHTYDPVAYKARNLIERMFCRLKDFRRIATRYGKRADTFASAIHIAVAITWWIN
jgi:transposase